VSETKAIQRLTVAPLEFTQEQLKMIRQSFLNGANEQEASVLLELARLRRLNPITKQIHFVKRWDSMKRVDIWSAQVGIDGFRAIAERTGLYDGQDEPAFEYDGKALKACRVKVYRRDWSRPAVGIAHFTEYAQYKKDKESGRQELTAMWASKPHVMLAKCAEALAFRKAFPEDTSGLYAPEEMGDEPREVQAERVPATSRTEELKTMLNAKPVQAQVVPPPNLGPWERVKELGKKCGKEGQALGSLIKGVTGKGKGADLTDDDVEKVRAALEVLTPKSKMKIVEVEPGQSVDEALNGDEPSPLTDEDAAGVFP
jgi:phage recombination protein Bet